MQINSFKKLLKIKMKIKQKGKSYKYIPLYFAKTDYNLNIGVHLTKEPDMFTFDDNPLTYRGLVIQPFNQNNVTQ